MKGQRILSGDVYQVCVSKVLVGTGEKEKTQKKG